MKIRTANYVITRQIQNSNIPFKYQVNLPWNTPVGLPKAFQRKTNWKYWIKYIKPIWCPQQTECSYHHLGRFVLFLYIGIANVNGFKLSMMLSYIVRSNAHKDYEDVAVCVALLALTFGVAPEYLNTFARWIDWFLYTTKLNLVSAILNLAMTKLAWYQSIRGFVVQERINTFVKLWFRCPLILKILNINIGIWGIVS